MFRFFVCFHFSNSCLIVDIVENLRTGYQKDSKMIWNVTFYNTHRTISVQKIISLNVVSYSCFGFSFLGRFMTEKNKIIQIIKKRHYNPPPPKEKAPLQHPRCRNRQLLSQRPSEVAGILDSPHFYESAT